MKTVTFEKKDKVDPHLWSMINSANILDYASSIGFTVVKKGNLFSLKEHDSVMFYKSNNFYRFATGHGGSLFQFIKEFVEPDSSKAFQIAQEYVTNNKIEFTTESFKTSKKDISDLKLPEHHSNNKKVIKYLCQERKIPYEIVKDYLDRQILYQDNNGNCIFAGYLDNKIYYAMKRSTYLKEGQHTFKGDIEGSFKEVGIFYDNSSPLLVVTEAVIDQMSYMTLHPEINASYLSVNGVASLQRVLNFHFLKRKGTVNKVIFALDNDEAGINATKAGIEFLESNFPDIQYSVDFPESKDWNEQLILNDSTYDFSI